MLTVREIRLSSVSVALCLDDRRSTAVLLYIEAFSRETDKALFRSCCERVLCSRRLRQEQIKRGRTVTKKKKISHSQSVTADRDRQDGILADVLRTYRDMALFLWTGLTIDTTHNAMSSCSGFKLSDKVWQRTYASASRAGIWRGPCKAQSVR